MFRWVCNKTHLKVESRLVESIFLGEGTTCGYDSSIMQEDAQECNLPCVYVRGWGLQAAGAGPPYPGFL